MIIGRFANLLCEAVAACMGTTAGRHKLDKIATLKKHITGALYLATGPRGAACLAHCGGCDSEVRPVAVPAIQHP